MFPATLVISGAATILTATTNAQFSGPYAPDTWTVAGAVVGDASAVFAADGSSLTVTGPDLGDAGSIDVTHTVVAGGTWSFDWNWLGLDSGPAFDSSYYLLNGAQILLSHLCGLDSGSVSISVNAGDIIGWRVTSIDGVAGPGILTATNFQIPGPSTLALLGLAGVPRSRRRAPEPEFA